MPILRSLIDGIKALFRKEQRNQDMEEELTSYLESAAQDKMRSGISDVEASRRCTVSPANPVLPKNLNRKKPSKNACQAPKPSKSLKQKRIELAY